MSHSNSTDDIWHDLHPMGEEGFVGALRLVWSSRTDVGRTRTVNEDAVLAAVPVFAVADGMGGHDAGDVASAVAIERLRDLIGPNPVAIGDVVTALTDANAEIVECGERSDAERSMGTTVAGLALVEQHDQLEWLVFNVGDSRVYRYVDRTLQQLSVDHSYVQELIDSGQIPEAAARTHPQRNVVTRALGIEVGAEADLWSRRPLLGERYLVCSDGLTSEVDDTEISRCLDLASPDRAASALVDAALGAGAHDNVSVVVVDVVADGRDSTESDGVGSATTPFQKLEEAT